LKWVLGWGDKLKMVGKILLVLEKFVNERRKKERKKTLKLGFLIHVFCMHSFALNITFQAASIKN
jgi:hypothetical protein